jgi:hypothetical protein
MTAEKAEASRATQRIVSVFKPATSAPPAVAAAPIPITAPSGTAQQAAHARTAMPAQCFEVSLVFIRQLQEAEGATKIKPVVNPQVKLPLILRA